ncbi:hypothetical protein [Verrucomicrobium spinosum]|uniref:hypothetical protein n=1 Tax=Verrucomicrobium spinosum TaxID=2736 RepID=UPI0009467DC3|nr:hypothetical protein [Verrucomicrobium spinosum]
MPFSTLVLTAGISALAPRNYFGKLFRKEDSPIKFDNGQQNPVPKDPTLSEEAVFNSCLTWAAHQTSQAQQLPPEEISAEFSILYAIAKQRNALAQGALVHLIHTPTLGGRLSATIQETALETQLGVQVHRQELSVPFDPTQRGGLAMASGAFIGQISRLLRDGHPDTTAFAPIGGYKSMVALGHIAASFHGLPSLYLHEDSQVLQEIAPAPVHFSEDDRATISSTARKIGNGAR